MKEIFKNGLFLFGRSVIVVIMCFFICISMSVLSTAIFTENIGYTAFGYTDDNEDGVELYTYYNADGDDTKKAEYEAQGYTLQTVNIRSQLSSTENGIFLTVTQICCIAILISFIYPSLWQLGCKDSNLVRFKHKSEDIFKGLKIGVIASIPSIIFFAIILICGIGAYSKLPASLYKFVNCQYFSFIELILKNTVTVGDINAIQYFLLFLLLLIIPATAFISYLLGYKDISISEKFIYKKKKG